MSGRSADFSSEEYMARREIVARSFSAQLDACVTSFHRLSEMEATELTRAALRRALIELLAHFSVYRTYATSGDRPARDRPFLQAAVAGAKRTCFPADREIVGGLAHWMAEHISDPDVAAIQNRAVTQFQQLSAPIAAKAVEDTAFYRYGRLLSRNDVGFEADLLGIDPEAFHARMLRRHIDFPHAMLATATHDHKRGEDVRARLAVLSEKAAEWASVLPRWIEQCGPLRHQSGDVRLPHAGDLAMLLQTIVGAWPLDLEVADQQGRRAFAERLARWQEKALREAKLVTDWSVPNQEYEAAARRLTMSLMADNALPDLLNDIAAFAKRISAAGAVNGLAQTLLKLTVPGVPDLYQGTELWDFSLVDPDNRRPVDFAARAASLDDTPLHSLTQNWRDGRIKQAVIARALALRRACPALFAEGGYEPLDVRGTFADRLIAFARRLDRQMVVAIIPRVASQMLRCEDNVLFDEAAWLDTAIEARAPNLTSLFVPGELAGKSIAAGKILRNFPVALLISPTVMHELNR
jgi:malto-oligosyltrehalose synthase